MLLHNPHAFMHSQDPQWPLLCTCKALLGPILGTPQETGNPMVVPPNFSTHGLERIPGQLLLQIVKRLMLCAPRCGVVFATDFAISVRLASVLRPLSVRFASIFVSV